MKKDAVLQVQMSSVHKKAAENVAIRQGFDSLQQVVRLFLCAFSDGRLKPIFTARLLKEWKAGGAEIDAVKKKIEAQKKADAERDEFIKEINAEAEKSWAEIRAKIMAENAASEDKSQGEEEKEVRSTRKTDC